MTNHNPEPIPSNEGRVSRGVRGLISKMVIELNIDEKEVAIFIDSYIHWNYGKLQ